MPEDIETTQIGSSNRVALDTTQIGSTDRVALNLTAQQVTYPSTWSRWRVSDGLNPTVSTSAPTSGVTTKWTQTHENGNYKGIVADDTHLYFSYEGSGTAPEQVSEADQADGVRNWTNDSSVFRLWDRMYLDATNNDLYGDDSQSVISLDTTDGSEQWQYTDISNTPEAVVLTSEGLAVPAVKAAMLDTSDGSEVWDAGDLSIDGAFAYDGTRLLPHRRPGTNEKIFSGLDKTDGTVDWSTANLDPEIPRFRHLSVGGDLFAFDNDHVWSFDPADGSTNWEQTYSGADFLIGAEYNGELYLVDGDEGNNELRAIDTADGASLWTATNWPSGRTASGTLQVANGFIYYTTRNTDNSGPSKLRCLDPSDQTNQWTFEDPNNELFRTWPIVAEGDIYVGDSSELIALEAA